MGKCSNKLFRLFSFDRTRFSFSGGGNLSKNRRRGDKNPKRSRLEKSIGRVEALAGGKKSATIEAEKIKINKNRASKNRSERLRSLRGGKNQVRSRRKKTKINKNRASKNRSEGLRSLRGEKNQVRSRGKKTKIKTNRGATNRSEGLRLLRGVKLQHDRGGKKAQHKNKSLRKKDIGPNIENLIKSKSKKHQIKKGSLSKKGLGGKKRKSCRGEKGKSQMIMQTVRCKKQTSTNSGSDEGKASPLDLSQVCRRKLARVAGGMRICCIDRDRRRAATRRGMAMQSSSIICRAAFHHLRLVMLTCRTLLCRITMGHPPVEGKWRHYSADECLKKAHKKNAKQKEKKSEE